jgi:superfamily II DNA or RNA helicase
MKLEDIAAGQSLSGIESEVIAQAVAAIPIGSETVQLVYRMPDGNIRETLLDRKRAENVSIATAESPWSFDGDGEAFKLAVEAKRIDLAFLFDPMMAIHTSNVEPLPHQITAVYESMLPRQPLRFVLADDPGAGKTIMAGLYIRELIMRADARRILIVSPGSLVEQWRDELFEKFGLEFRIFSKELEAASPTGNAFSDHDQVIVRLDQMARNEELQEKLCSENWDLVIFDEAHKLSAHFYGQKLEKTGRYKFAERIGAHTRHLLLMTATPHNGKEEDFQLFLGLLDSDRFYGKFRDGVHKVDTSDLIRRMVKEELVKFDGTPLFPERRAYTVNYKLSDIEVELYELVTHYVTTEMGKADKLDGKRRGSVGFALTALQRRVASSPQAIFQSLNNRRDRLEKRLREGRLSARGQSLLSVDLSEAPEDDDDLNATEQEELEEALVDQATAAMTVAELEDEVRILGDLIEKAREVVLSGNDRKWDELSKILQNDARTRDADGQMRKLIVFTEHRATLDYLQQRITGVLGSAEAVVTIHGGTHRDERRKVQALFRSDKAVRVLIATDAAGEGVNLQNANLMVNYDLPWNPNRLEQRFGRIHRIGQQEVCHLWNLVANETREGDVYYRLLTKIETISDAFKGKVFDVLGEAFEERSLKDMLMEAIRYNDQPEVKSRLTQVIDSALDEEHIRDLLDRNALSQEQMSPERLFSVKEQMEKAEARKLQPYFVRSFFMTAFQQLGGSIYPREMDRWEITHVPAALRERDRQITGRNRRDSAPVLRSYERVCFTKEAVRPEGKPNAPMGILLHPGHPLMLSVSDVILEQHANLLRQGAILLDPSDEGTEPSLIFLLTHEIKSGEGTVLSKRLQFVRVRQDGTAEFAGWAPHLDMEPISKADRALLDDTLAEPWLHAGLDQQALTLAAQTLVPEHYDEVATRRIQSVDKTLHAVNERLSKEISFWSDRYVKLSGDKLAGKDVRLNLENVRRTLSDLESRLDLRKRELQAMRHVTSATPVVLSGALVIPAGLLNKLKGEEPTPGTFGADPVARAKVERLAMEAVTRTEEARGCVVTDVSAQKCGWDITSQPSEGTIRHIEVKGRAKGAPSITITRNEILYALNQSDKFVLAIVLVDEDDSTEGPYYLKNPFIQEPDYGVASINYELGELLKKASPNN